MCGGVDRWTANSLTVTRRLPQKDPREICPKIRGYYLYQSLKTVWIVTTGSREATGTYLVGGGQECCYTAYNAQDSPPTKNQQPQMLAVPRLRNPNLYYASHSDK